METPSIQEKNIAQNASLKNRFVTNAQPSKFYGCNTALFAQSWTQTYGTPAEGAEGKVSFQAEGFGGIEKSATIGWRQYDPT
jgi:hypothetical protein